jgi:hypothetical protein
MILKLFTLFSAAAVAEQQYSDPLLNKKMGKITDMLKGQLAHLKHQQTKDVEEADFCKGELKDLKERLSKQMQVVKEKLQVVADTKEAYLKAKNGELKPREVAEQKGLRRAIDDSKEQAVKAAKDFAIVNNWDVFNPAYDPLDDLPAPVEPLLIQAKPKEAKGKPAKKLSRAQLEANVADITRDFSVSRAAIEKQLQHRRVTVGGASESDATSVTDQTSGSWRLRRNVPGVKEDRDWKDAQYDLKDAMKRLENVEKEHKIIRARCVQPTSRQTPEERAAQREEEIDGLNSAWKTLR